MDVDDTQIRRYQTQPQQTIEILRETIKLKDDTKVDKSFVRPEEFYDLLCKFKRTFIQKQTQRKDSNLLQDRGRGSFIGIYE